MKTAVKQPTTKLIPVVSYVRMSSGKQQDSPEQQRAELKKLAKEHGYDIIREYYDGARSGTSVKGRTGFQRLMADAQKSPDFKFIVVWDQDRFSRGDALEAGHYWYLLREAGIRIHSVNQGVIETEELGDFLKASVVQSGKRGYVVDLSRNSMRGSLKVAKEGKPTGRIAYGYQHIATDGSGQSMKLVRNTRSRKPGGWSVRLELSDNRGEVETVKWIFDTYVNSLTSIRAIAADLNKRKVPAPIGRQWYVQTVVQMLTNQTYVGTAAYGLRRWGSLHQVTEDGEIGLPKPGKRKEKPSVVVEDAHPAIVSKQLFNAAQDRLISRRIEKAKPKAGGALLSSLMHCGHCGGKMYAHKSGQKGHRLDYYVCTNSSVKGVCRAYSISMPDIDEFVMDLLKRNLFSTEAIKRFRSRAAKQAGERRGKQPDRAKSLQAQIAELERKIKRGLENLLEVDKRHAKDLSDILNGLRTQRAALQAELDGLSVSDRSGVPVDAVVARLKEAGALLDSRDRPKVKQLLQSIIQRIDLWFFKQGKRYRLSKGICTLAGGDVLDVSDSHRQCGHIQNSFSFGLPEIPGLWLSSEVAAFAVKTLDKGQGVSTREVAEHLGTQADCTYNRLKFARAAGIVKQGPRGIWIATGKLFGGIAE
jgi:DNA invertase Pin-like site-specific DNA recombinase